MHDSPDVFDHGVWTRAKWRSVRRFLLVAVGVIFFVECLGLPEIRLEKRGRAGYAVYYGLQGRTVVSGYGERPLVVLRKLDTSLVRYAQNMIAESVAVFSNF